MKRISFISVVSLLVGVFFISCMQEEYEFDKLNDDIRFRIGMVAPVAKGELNIGDLIQQVDSSGFIDTYEDGLLYLTYTDSLFSYSANDLINFPDQSFFQYFYESDADIPAAFVLDSIVVERTQDVAIEFTNNERIDSILLDDGTLHFDISSSFQHTGYLAIVIPSIQKDGEPLDITFQISSGDGSYVATEDFSLQDYAMILDNSNADTSFIHVSFRLVFYDSGNPITSTDAVLVDASIIDMDFGSAYGYVGEYEVVAGEGSVDIPFFESDVLGDLLFDNPQFNFILSNSYGVPIQADITKFRAYSSVKDDSVDLTFDPGVNPFSVAYPSINEIGQRADTTLSINGENSTIEDVLAFFPTSITYDVSAITNPDQDTSTNNFVLDTSTMDVDFEFILPLHFKARGFSLVDTLELNLEGISEDASMIDSVTIILNIENELPVDISAQLYFMDEFYQKVDSLFSNSQQPFIKSGTIDTDGNVTSPTIYTQEITITNDELTNLELSRFGLIDVSLETPGYDSDVRVKFFDYYSVKFNVGVRVNGTVDSNDF